MNKDTAWFEALYQKAEEDHTQIPWAKLEANPFLVEFLESQINFKGKALVIGCGLGDDAKVIADAGFETTAIDISQSAIKWAKKRFCDDTIDFQVQDVLALPESFLGHFDFVFEALTIQSLPIAYRPRMIEAVASTVALKGRLLVVAHGKNKGEKFEGPPWPLLVNELGLFRMHDLTQMEFSIHAEPSGLSSLKFKALYQN
ncbi:MAG: class I SAM-dependent methyltransferase [Epsilonproteobacteria bacterium]|nr:class I SAM-dependent methyltransferase [Campylobacterota bacterium]